MGEIKWDLALTLLFAWVVVYCCICKGIKSSGKVFIQRKLLFRLSNIFWYPLDVLLNSYCCCCCCCCRYCRQLQTTWTMNICFNRIIISLWILIYYSIRAEPVINRGAVLFKEFNVLESIRCFIRCWLCLTVQMAFLEGLWSSLIRTQL